MIITKAVRLTLATVLAGGLAGGLAATPAHAVSTCTFRPISLTANTLDDPWPDNYDEIRLSYGSVTYRHDQTFRGQNLTNLPSTTFSGRLTVNLTELDGGVWWNPNDDLGTFTVDSLMRGQQPTHFFAGDGANYALDYSVTCP